jgi:hypothetical protein
VIEWFLRFGEFAKFEAAFYSFKTIIVAVKPAVYTDHRFLGACHSSLKFLQIEFHFG